jgi:hypothetical protein
MDRNCDDRPGRPDSAGTGFPVESRARRWCRLFAQILITVLALAMILAITPWNDRVTLADGRRGIVLEETEEPLAVRLRQPAGDSTSAVAAADVKERQPGVKTLLAHARVPWLLTSLGCAAAIGMLLVIRWRYLLLQSGGDFSIPWCAAIWARGQVINLLPLSQIGGDLYRIERTRHGLGGTAASVGIIATERVCGLIALVGVAMAGLACSGMLSLGPFIVAMVSVVVTAGVLLAVKCARPRQESESGVPPIHPQLEIVRNGECTGPTACRSHAKLSPWWHHLQRMIAPLVGLLSTPKRLLTVLSLSIAVQLLAPLSFATVDRALGFDTPVWCYLVAIPAITLAIFLPVHVAGIGIVEGGLWLFLSRWSERTVADVVAISAATRLAGLIWTSLLASAFLMRADRTLRRRPRAAAGLTHFQSGADPRLESCRKTGAARDDHRPRRPPAANEGAECIHLAVTTLTSSEKGAAGRRTDP